MKVKKRINVEMRSRDFSCRRRKSKKHVEHYILFSGISEVYGNAIGVQLARKCQITQKTRQLNLECRLA